MDGMQKLVLATNARFDQLLVDQCHCHEQGKGSTNHNGSGNNIDYSYSALGGSTNSIISKITKMDFLRCDKEDTITWVCQAEQFLKSQQTITDEKAPSAPIHPKGVAP
ncbi:unnamed protein product, partial [Ilex paraguariensis]